MGTKSKTSETAHPKLKLSETPKLRIADPPGTKTKSQNSIGTKIKISEHVTATPVKPQDATPNKMKIHEKNENFKQNKPKSEKSLNPLKLSISSGSIIRSSEPVNKVDQYNFSLSMNNSNPDNSSKEKT